MQHLWPCKIPVYDSTHSLVVMSWWLLTWNVTLQTVGVSVVNREQEVQFHHVTNRTSGRTCDLETPSLDKRHLVNHTQPRDGYNLKNPIYPHRQLESHLPNSHITINPTHPVWLIHSQCSTPQVYVSSVHTHCQRTLDLVDVMIWMI